MERDPDSQGTDGDDVEAARSIEYALLASLLLRAPDAEALARLSGLRAGPTTPLGLAHRALAEAAAVASAETVKREYFDLFLGVGRGEIVPYANLLGELVELTREDAAALGCATEIARAPEILERGTSAHRQRKVYTAARAAGADKREALTKVVDALIAETMEGV